MPSDRLLDQRLRNRIIESLHTLSEGDEGVPREWPTEYFMGFYDWVPHHKDGQMPPNSAITAQEMASLIEVSALLDAACDATQQIMTPDELIKTGWPERIKPFAERSLNLMLERGRFSEDFEEEDPSDTTPWP